MVTEADDFLSKHVSPAALALDAAIGAAPVPLSVADPVDHFVDAVRAEPPTDFSPFNPAYARPEPPCNQPSGKAFGPSPQVAQTAKPYLAALKIAFAAGNPTIAETAVLGLAQKLVEAEARLEAVKEMLK